MQEEIPSILRRNIKYNRLIQSAILICFIILLGIPMQLNEGADAKPEVIGLSAGVTNATMQMSKEPLPKELSAGVSNAMLQVLKELHVDILEVYTVSAAADTLAESKAEAETETETVAVAEGEAETETVAVADSEAEAETETVDVEESEPETVYKSLEEVKISRNMDLTETTGLSREDFCELLANFKYDYAGFYERNSGLIWDLSQEYQVNEFFICGVFAEESLYGSNEAHISTHNYGSIMITEVVKVEDENGEEKEIKIKKLKPYSSDEEGIRANFELFANSYLSPDGKYYKGVTLDSIGNTYCDSKWAGQVYSCMKYFLEE